MVRDFRRVILESMLPVKGVDVKPTVPETAEEVVERTKLPGDPKKRTIPPMNYIYWPRPKDDIGVDLGDGLRLYSDNTIRSDSVHIGSYYPPVAHYNPSTGETGLALWV